MSEHNGERLTNLEFQISEFVRESREYRRQNEIRQGKQETAIAGTQSQITELQELTKVMTSALQKLIDYETNGRAP